MTTEEKFYAAVNVIRNLPKNGMYQPSNELQLRFYGYYKQATEGPCTKPKPAFWEVIKKAKWDAWTRLGNMSRTEAMNNYVEELKKIVETMSYTDNVADFLGSLGSFYETVPAEDLEMLVGPVLERVRSQPGSPLSGSPLGSRETSPHRHRSASSRHITSSLETSPASSHSASPLPPDTDGEEEEFIDTVESAPERNQKESASGSGVKRQVRTEDASTTATSQESKPKERVDLANGHAGSSGGNTVSDPKERSSTRGKGKKEESAHTDFYNQMATTVENLQRDLDRITARVRALEGQSLRALAPPPAPSPNGRPQRVPQWWPIRECSPRIFAFFVLWPFAVQLVVMWARRYRERKL